MAKTFVPFVTTDKQHMAVINTKVLLCKNPRREGVNNRSCFEIWHSVRDLFEEKEKIERALRKADSLQSGSHHQPQMMTVLKLKTILEQKFKNLQ
jgi:hypothetical protein